MKPLRNPWMVGCLCVIAAGVVGYQFLAARRPGGVTPAPQTTAGASPPPAASPTTRVVSGTNDVGGSAPIDRAYVESHFAQWLQAPKRDPFLFSVLGQPGTLAGSSVSHWKLRSIWRQTGSRLAVINQNLYAEGDQIEGYTLLAIESDRVWFQCATGRVSLGFTTSTPTNAASAATNPAARFRATRETLDSPQRASPMIATENRASGH
jgi:hypothetical protein